MYEVIISTRALKQISKLDKDIQERIYKVLERIRTRPEAHVTKLVGDTAYKLRVGDYRLLIDINQQQLIVLVIKAGHRKNIYNRP
ncbi:type II toxin-antitoxin system RelE/ParE family toxin [Candidatus Woesearchaeota archaeon]|nr:type II toxin-antitoxin system RelE/ParE family toxin [Candidatus Woesearchaeota archaeon]